MDAIGDHPLRFGRAGAGEHRGGELGRDREQAGPDVGVFGADQLADDLHRHQASGLLGEVDLGEHGFGQGLAPLGLLVVGAAGLDLAIGGEGLHHVAEAVELRALGAGSGPQPGLGEAPGQHDAVDPQLARETGDAPPPCDLVAEDDVIRHPRPTCC